MPNSTYTLTVSCKDKSGLIAAITGCIASAGGNILNLAQHTAVDVGMFFCRISFACSSGFEFSEEDFKLSFSNIAEKYSLSWQLFNNAVKKRVAVLVSKTSHCLYEILLKHADGYLDCDIPVVISNHPDLANIATSFHVPFYQVDPAKGKEAYEEDLNQILEEYKVDLVALARYMQILSGPFCRKWEHRVINIHHGFLPAFQGAKPYHRAWKKGVKIIGATGHFATEDLDEGPIIFQDVIRVSDTHSIEEFIDLGKDVERRVFVEAVRRYLNHAIFIHEGRTFVIE